MQHQICASIPLNFNSRWETVVREPWEPEEREREREKKCVSRILMGSHSSFLNWTLLNPSIFAPNPNPNPFFPNPVTEIPNSWHFNLLALVSTDPENPMFTEISSWVIWFQEREGESEWENEEIEDLLYAFETPTEYGAAMDLPLGDWLHGFSVPSFSFYGDRSWRNPSVSVLPLGGCFQFVLRRIEAPPDSNFFAPSAAALRLPNLRLDRRREYVETDAWSSVPSD